jgi:hypothetical protein
VWGAWRDAGTLTRGTRIAVIRRGGAFIETANPAPERIRLTAYMLGDGHLGAQYFGFTSLPGAKLDEFRRDIRALGGTTREYCKANSRAIDVRLRQDDTPLRHWITEDGLLDSRSHTKFIPTWVFGLSRENTALFLNRLWATDGHVKKNSPGKYTIEYCTTSKRMAREIQALLWKFGVPTKCYSRTSFAVRRGPTGRKIRVKGRRAYKLRVETREGVRLFLSEIGALEKTEKISPPEQESNNNRDTYPREINKDVQEIVDFRGSEGLSGSRAEGSLHEAGLRAALQYPLTFRKLAKYCTFFRRDPRYPITFVSELEAHLTTDLFWDEIVSVEDAGTRKCVDFEVEETHNFVAAGIVTHNSTSLANFLIAESVAIPHFKSYYVSPSKEQTIIFSNTRVGKTLSYSPIIKKHFQSPEHADRVLHRSYTNGSENAFTYACDDADRARGFSADRVSYDEFQDMLYDSVVPVINSCMKNSNYRFETYAGTPKTMEASIEYLWSKSSQSEWVMKCEGCSKHNFVVSEKSLGKHGPICLNCGHVLNPRTGQWIDMKKVDSDTGKHSVKGFHIPQLIMPLNIPSCVNNTTEKPNAKADAQARWDDILRDHEMFSAAKFRNEVIGVSDAVGRRLISLEELEALCTGTPISPFPNKNMEGCSLAVAGVDWSGGGTTGVSRTVLWIWGWHPATQKLRTLYFRIYPGNNAVTDVEDIARICQQYSVAMVIGDAGEGALPNATLRERLGAHRVHMVQYGALGAPLKHNGLDRYQADRTTMIDNYLMFLKRGAAVYPPKEETKEPIKDILNVYEEVTVSGKKVWRHSPQLPDDCLHAQLFGWFALKLVMNDLKFYA